MSTFYLIRHGEKDVPPGALSGRSEGVSLTANGRAQAERVGARLADVGFSRVYTSPLERALETARNVARPHGLEVETCQALTEIDYGDWTNARERDLDGDPAFRRWNAFRSGARVPGGESMHDVQLRMMRALLSWHGSQPGETIAVISHGDPIKAAILYVLGAPLDFWHRIDVDQGSTTIVEIFDDAPRLFRMNVPA